MGDHDKKEKRSKGEKGVDLWKTPPSLPQSHTTTTTNDFKFN